VNLWVVSLIVFLINLPFGYWRAGVKKFSRQWMLSIHLPVPFVIALRIYSGLGWAFITFPVLIGAFFLGQLSGGLIRRLFNNNPEK
jgi:F0F1-type ATP synthase membrane subunit a